MAIGDVLEILGAAAVAVAFLLWFGVPAMLAVVGVALVYEGQCFGGHPLPIKRPQLKLPKFRRSAER